MSSAVDPRRKIARQKGNNLPDGDVLVRPDGNDSTTADDPQAQVGHAHPNHLGLLKSLIHAWRGTRLLHHMPR